MRCGLARLPYRIAPRSTAQHRTAQHSATQHVSQCMPKCVIDFLSVAAGMSGERGTSARGEKEADAEEKNEEEPPSETTKRRRMLNTKMRFPKIAGGEGGGAEGAAESAVLASVGQEAENGVAITLVER